MNIDDIKKGLECCSNPRLSSCNNCPYNNNGEFSCRDGEMCKDALNLITEQEKKIEQLTEERNRYAETLAKYQMASDKEIIAQRKRAKIDVLNELKTHGYYDDDYMEGYVFVSDIDELLKEYENDT